MSNAFFHSENRNIINYGEMYIYVIDKSLVINSPFPHKSYSTFNINYRLLKSLKYIYCIYILMQKSGFYIFRI